MSESTNNAFDGLRAIVQYRRKDQIEFDPWHNMAAFDAVSVAESYCVSCAVNNNTWEYQVIDLETGQITKAQDRP